MAADDKLKSGDIIAEAISTSGVTVPGENKIATSAAVKDGLAFKAELRRKGEL